MEGPSRLKLRRFLSSHATGTFDEAVEYALLEHMYNERDAFGWLPTGYGTSICYKMLPFVFAFRIGKCSGS